MNKPTFSLWNLKYRSQRHASSSFHYIGGYFSFSAVNGDHSIDECIEIKTLFDINICDHYLHMTFVWKGGAGMGQYSHVFCGNYAGNGPNFVCLPCLDSSWDVKESWASSQALSASKNMAYKLLCSSLTVYIWLWAPVTFSHVMRSTNLVLRFLERPNS